MKNILKKIIICTLLVFCTLPAMAEPLGIEGYKISGTVLDQDKMPIIGAGISYHNDLGVGYTDIDGNFDIVVKNANSLIDISAISFKTETFRASELQDKTVILEQDTESTTLDGAYVVDCGPKPEQGIALAQADPKTNKCIPTKCIEPRWVLRGVGNGKFCEDQVGLSCTTKIKHAKHASYQMVGNTLVCTLEQCDDGYDPDFNNNECISKDGTPCNDASELKKINAKAGIWVIGTLRRYCYPTECLDGFLEQGAGPDMKCRERTCNKTELRNQDRYAVSGTFNESAQRCDITACDPGYTPSADRAKCDALETDCTDTAKQRDKNVLRAEWEYEKDGTKWCRVISCTENHKPNDDESGCIQTSGDCKSTIPHATSANYTRDKSGNLKCELEQCETGYIANKSTDNCVERDCTARAKQIDPNATYGEIEIDRRGNETCVIRECRDDFVVKNNKCEPTKCDNCLQDFNPTTGKCENITDLSCTMTGTSNVRRAEYTCENKKRVCRIVECEEFYTRNNARTQCTSVVGTKCTASQVAPSVNTANAKTYKWRSVGGQVLCLIDECRNNNYKPNDAGTQCLLAGGDCTSQIPNARSAEYELDLISGETKCLLKSCKEGWEPDYETNKCNQNKCTTTQRNVDGLRSDQASAVTIENGECVATACHCGYELKDKKCVDWGNKLCTNTTTPALPQYADADTTFMKCKNKRAYCHVTKCTNSAYTPNSSNTKCVDTAGEPCDSYPSDPHATAGKWKKVNGQMECLISECADQYKPASDGKSCVQTECTSDDPYANKTKFVNGTCVITSCRGNYIPDPSTPNPTKCVQGSGEPCDEYPSDPHATAGKWKKVNGQMVCLISECDDQYEPASDGKSCVQTECTSDDPYANKTKFVNGTCVITSCRGNYIPDPSTPNPTKCVQGSGEPCDEYPSDPHATAGKWKKVNGQMVCLISECADQYKPASDGKSCVQTECTVENATRTKLENGKCIVKKCIDGYMPDPDSAQPTKCVPSAGDCTPDDKNATAGQYIRNGKKCIPTECIPGYEVKNKKCVAIGGKCDKSELPENAKSGTRAFDSATNTEYCQVTACSKGFVVSSDKRSCVQAAKQYLSEEDSKKRVEELQENYQAQKENEQSLKNRILGATGIGMTGIGGMQVASALAEQGADADAEIDMTAYLATFRCDYGAGKQFKGGEMGISLPGASELVPLYAEYVALANDLKTRKNALGMRAGIESQTILDSATTGLYDDVSTGITSGTYASLSRAISDPEGMDAQLWAALKQQTADKLKTGAIIAGIGAVGSLIGNIALNHNAPKENSAEIMAKYAGMYQVFNQAEQDFQQQVDGPTCADYKLTGTYPNCNCPVANQTFHPDHGCQCDGDLQLISGKCQCPNGKTQNGTKCTETIKDPTCADFNLNGTYPQCDCGENKLFNGAKCIDIPDLSNIEIDDFDDEYYDFGDDNFTNLESDKLKCEYFGGVGTYPNCTCTDPKQIFNVICQDCPGDLMFRSDLGICACPQGMIQQDTTCTDPQPECELTGLVATDKCECIANAHSNEANQCVCNTGYTQVGNDCTLDITSLIPETEPIASISFSSDLLFDSGKDELKTDAKKFFKDFSDKIDAELAKVNQQYNANITLDTLDYCILVIGHTDHQPFKNPDNKTRNNQSLSERRAKRVADILTDNGLKNVKSKGVGDKECDASTYPNKIEQQCRRVDIEFRANGTCN